MQVRYRPVTAAVWALAALVAVAGCVSMTGVQPGSGEYYVVDGERISLAPSPFARGVSISQPFDQELILDLIDGLARLELSPLLERNKLVLLRRLSGRADSQLAEAVRLVSEEFQGSETPIFHYEDIDLVLVNEFIVHFQPGVTPEQARLLLNEFGAAVMKDNEDEDEEESESEIASGRYLFEFNWFDERGAMEALHRVNELNERDIVISAKPDFVLLYSEEMTSAPDPGAAYGPEGGLVALGYEVPVDIDGNPFPCDSIVDPDDEYFCEQWGLEQIGAPAAWLNSTGEDITIAVIDTGVWEHDDLPYNAALLPAYDAIPEHEGAPEYPDSWGPHGTHVTGVVAARSNDGTGIAGVAPNVQVLPIRIGYFTGVGSALTSQQSWICDGVQHAIDNDVGVILSSMHWPPDTSEECALEAFAEGTVLVFSAGNGDPDVDYPANLAGSTSTIAVSASDEGDELEPPSNSGPEVTVSAPGRRIWTTDIPGLDGQTEGDYHIGFSATSSAAPFVAGVAALLLEQYPLAQPMHIKAWIENSADNIGQVDPNYGYGRLNANSALVEAGNYLLQISVAFPDDRLGDGERKSVMVVVSRRGLPQENVRVEFSTDNAEWLTIVTAPEPTDTNGITTVLIEGRTSSNKTAHVTARVDGKSVTAPVKLASVPVWSLALCLGVMIGFLTGAAFARDARPIAYSRVFLVVAVLASFLFVDVFGAPALEWVLSPLTIATTAVTKTTLHWLGFAVSKTGAVLFVPGGFAYEINHHCAGFWPIAMFAAYVLCAYGPKRNSVGLLLQGISLLLLLNWARLIHLFWVGTALPNQFALMHDVLWPIVMILSVVILLGLNPSSRQFWTFLSRRRA